MNDRIANFSAGPSQLPLKVLKNVQKNLLNYNNCGQSVLEMSHRSKEFDNIFNDSQNNIKKLLKIPENYSVFFVQGGATSVFSMIPLNFNIRNTNKTMDYIITGNWSKKAAEEASKFGKVNIIYDTTKDTIPCIKIPNLNEIKINNNSAYLHLCINETVHGCQFKNMSFINNINIPIIADFSSCFMSEPIDISKFAIIYAGAQKNIGPAGVTVLIVNNKYIGNCDPLTPVLFDFKTYKKKLIPNTPPCFSIYVMGEVFKYLLNDINGLENMKKINENKAKLLYNEIDKDNFYNAPVLENARSIMNVRFNLKTKELEKKFIEKAKENGMVNLKGYRTLGGIRASIYNAQPIENVQKFVTFMQQFRKENS